MRSCAILRLTPLPCFIETQNMRRAVAAEPRATLMTTEGMTMSTYEFTVTVKTQYLPEQSAPDQGRHVFSYTIRVVNTGTAGAQLISRHWVITDANNKVEEVRGLGAVGHQPLLQPGEQFEDTSGTMLGTPQGSMHGEYFCVAEDGHQFEAPIPEFVLSVPRTLH